MAGKTLKAIYTIILILTIVFAIVELGLASELLWEINRRFIGFGGIIRPRTRYLIFCSAWGTLSGLLILILLAARVNLVAQPIVMLISVILWLVAAAIFTSLTGGGISCGSRYPSCFVVNIVNATLAFAWINWSFALIGFFLALALAIAEPDSQAPTNTPTRQTDNKTPQPTTTPATTTTNGSAPPV